MIQSRRPKLLDLVAVLKCLPETDIEVGDVSIVVELLPPDGIEVESGPRWPNPLPRHVVCRGCPHAEPRTNAGRRLSL